MDGKSKRIIKELKGHSGNKINLCEVEGILYVEKTGDIQRNVERLMDLHRDMYPVPFIFETDRKTYLNMDYIHGIDMKEYLKTHTIHRLSQFITGILNSFKVGATLFDYTGVYYQKLQFLDEVDDLPFTKEELIAKLPKELPKTNYHGDFTLENLIYSNDDFTMIDAVTIEYDSYIFDIAKLRQDLECKWFLRESDLRLNTKLKMLQENVLKQFPEANDDYLLILMLLRVYRHTEKDDDNRKFILKWINKLWK